MENTQLKRVVRYECRWCGKLFKTPNRHNCRFDPKHHNCLSCRHCGKFGKYEDIVVQGFRCERDGTEVGEGGWNDFPYALSVKGQGCPDWEQMEGYVGTRSFAERQRKLEQ